jgi:ribosome-associated protein
VKAPRKPKVKKASGAELLGRILEVLDENKAEDVVTIDLEGKSPLADYMVVASGRSGRQVQALADYVGRASKDLSARLKVEGKSQGDWVLIDAGDVVVHIFRPEVREFYKIEAMWGFTTPETGNGGFIAQ